MPERASIFLDKHVFQHDYVPERIIHRDRQTEKIRLILSDTERGTRPRNILCIGSFGTGKTAAIRRFCHALANGTASAYLNCSEQNTQNRIIREVLRGLGCPVKPGFPKDHYLMLFKKAVAERSWLVLVLDEVDRLIDRRDSECDELFYTLSRSVSNVVVIMLTNRVDLEQRLQVILDSRVKDTFRYELVEFPDYTAKELMDILRERCVIGLRRGSYDEGIIAMIGRKAYQLGIRARGLLDTIRKASEIAETKGHVVIAEQDVRDSIRELSHEQDMEVIKRLPAVQKAILRYVLQNPVPEVMLYAWYRTEVSKVYDVGPSPTRFYDHIKQLRTLGLLTQERHGLGRGRGQVARLTVTAEIAAMVASSLQNEDTHPIAESVTGRADILTRQPPSTPTDAALPPTVGEPEGVGNRENRHFTNTEMGSGGSNVRER